MQHLFDALAKEHEDLRKALAALRAMAPAAGRSRAFPVEDCLLVLRYLREFVLPVHCQVESECLLQGVSVHGNEKDLEHVGALVRAHEDLQTLVHSLAVLWEPRGNLTAAEREGFVRATDSLCKLFERSIELEETWLFAAARRVPLDDQLDWPAHFETLHTSHRPSGEWHRDIEALGDRWCPPGN
jgi:hemerythrin-like domain-containing protein